MDKISVYELYDRTGEFIEEIKKEGFEIEELHYDNILKGNYRIRKGFAPTIRKPGRDEFFGEIVNSRFLKLFKYLKCEENDERIVETSFLLEKIAENF